MSYCSTIGTNWTHLSSSFHLQRGRASPDLSDNCARYTIAAASILGAQYCIAFQLATMANRTIFRLGLVTLQQRRKMRAGLAIN